MPNPLSKELRNLLARVTLEARETAESAALAALENLAVHEKDYRRHMSVAQRELRNRLRERGRALGDERDIRTGTQAIKHLTEDAAYENWHRILFTRFLTENHLLHTDESHGSVPITLEECEELASELGARDGFDLACRFASEILPGVFRSHDPVLGLTLAVNDQVELRKLLDSLPCEVFTSDDALGWTYQFWQATRKDEVNASGKKIGADELPAVTQLFTEDYMVEFLLHNTLGAWWAGKAGPIAAATEEEARDKVSLPKKDGLGITWTYLRLVRGERTKTWTPAAGTFDGWPKVASEVTFLDPCMGSGHFPVFALSILARLRMEEEKLHLNEAVHGVLEDNLFGLELDPRCAQIAAFNVALTAWKLAGYQVLPRLQFACSGVAPRSTEKDWLALAGENERLRIGMERLFALFSDAPVLGSLINPRAMWGDLFAAEFHELQPLMEKAVAREADAARRGFSPDRATKAELSVTARGLAMAAEILARTFTLVATNVPYLGRGKQDDILQAYCQRVHPAAKADLATCFVERSLDFCARGAAVALVTPQNWLFLSTYQDLRTQTLRLSTWLLVARLGPHGFTSIGGEVVQTALPIIKRQVPPTPLRSLGLDAASGPGERAILPEEKANLLRGCPASDHLPTRDGTLRPIDLEAILASPGSAFSFGEISNTAFLCDLARSFVGLQTGDSPRWIQSFWEQPIVDNIEWWPFQLAPEETKAVEGCVAIVRWGMSSELREAPGARIQGLDAWGKRGVLIQRMSSLKATLYHGQPFDTNTAAIIPMGGRVTVEALFAFCASPSFATVVRDRAPGLSITNQALVNVPFFPVAHDPLAEIETVTSDPTQWLFRGEPRASDSPLHVATARLLGYLWPRQTGLSFPDCPALDPDGLEEAKDLDGIVCLQSINREQPAAHRLRALLLKALNRHDERALISSAGSNGSKSSTLDEWLRDEFFEQHCDLFHQRPFIWHIWDGRKDGFHALVNYHRLDHANLQKLTYSYLGDWIRLQEEDANADKPGGDARLGAARALQVALAQILEGEAPYDIFVRWKPLSMQVSGWNPNLNDGVRLNIRPFVTANILRKRVKVKWEKDRGNEPHRDKPEYPWFWSKEDPGTDPTPGREFVGARWNDVHLTLERKRRARGKA